MKKITLIICYFSFFSIVLFSPVELRANFVPGAFNAWFQNTPYVTSNMPAGYKKYTAIASNDNEFKLMMWSDNWNAGWGSGYWINSWNTVWNLPYVGTGLSNAFVKNFGTNQYMTVVTSTVLTAATSKFGFLKTSASPITISSVSGGTANVNANTSVSVIITLSSSKCAEEYVLLRYTTDNWATSSIVTATGSGTSYSATIPAQLANKTVEWYALTSTVANPSSDIDYLTLSVMNNSAANYKYYTGQSAANDYFRSKATGNWNTAATWESSANGSSNWIPSNLAPTNSATSVTVMAGHKVNVDGNTTIGTLSISSTGTLEVNAAKQLTVNTSLTNNGTLNLLSDASGTATILTPTIISTGEATFNVQQFLASGRNWWYLSSPLSGATSDVFAPTSSTNKIGYFIENQTTPDYSAPFAAGSATSLVVGTGYVVKLAATTGGTYNFTGGSLNNGTYSLTPTRTGTTAGQRGFNLVGNPYPSYLDWDAVYTDGTNPQTNMRNAIWFRTYDEGMKFHTYSDGEGVPATTSAKIAPMQAFWVKVDKDNTAASLTFKNTHRSHFTTGANPLKVKANDERQRIRLVVSDGTSQDEMLIVGKSHATAGLDAYDIEKMSNDNLAIPEIYSLIGNQEFVINSTSPIVANQEIKIGLRPTSAGTFSIKATQMQNVPSELRVILKDAINGSEIELSEGVTYPFEAGTEALNNRFSIQFRSKGVINNLNENQHKNIFAYQTNNNQIAVMCDKDFDGVSKISVFNSVGQKLIEQEISSSSTTISRVFNPGVYLISIDKQSGSPSFIKVIVK